ncbi:MAG: hypothetical protein KME26_24930 [Oscillatoria princeps RMCB-10]|nr:hypothetical protein [Oscillatoria princeps RMCB-10]
MMADFIVSGFTFIYNVAVPAGGRAGWWRCRLVGVPAGGGAGGAALSSSFQNVLQSYNIIYRETLYG